MKAIFLSASGISGFRTWSLAHMPSEGDKDPAAGDQPLDAAAAAEPAEQPHRPWVTQGTGNVL